MVNSYFDFDNYDEPVQTYIDDRYSYNTISGYTKYIRIFVSKNEAELQDTFFTYAPGGDKKEFISVNSVDQDLAVDYEETGEVLKIHFYKDYGYKHYERSVFSILDLTGKLGGVNEVFEITGSLIVAFFADRLFFYSIISSLFQVDTLSKNELDFKVENHKINHHFRNESNEFAKVRSETDNLPLEENKEVEKSS